MRDRYKNYHLANFFPARVVAAGCLHRVMRRRGLSVENRDQWVSNITGGKVDSEDFEEVLFELGKIDSSRT